MGSDTINVVLKRQTHRDLWQMKDEPGDTYDEIVRELYEFYQTKSGADSDGGGSE
jgi:hypothetical protein